MVLLTSKMAYMKNLVNYANCGSTSRVWKLRTVVTVLAGSVDSDIFFLVLTGSANDEVSTLDIEIAPLFVLILLFSLARFISLHFCWLLFCIFSFFAFCLLFLQFSSSCVFPLNSRVFWLFEDDWQPVFCHPLNSCCQPLFFKFYWV